MDHKGQSYETIMENSAGFNNPNNIKYLSDLVGLGQQNYSNMIGLRYISYSLNFLIVNSIRSAR